MGVSVERVIELALIKLMFAIADLDASSNPQENIAMAKENMISVVADLARIAPRFDLDVGSTASDESRSSRKRRRARLVN